MEPAQSRPCRAVTAVPNFGHPAHATRGVTRGLRSFPHPLRPFRCLRQPNARPRRPNLPPHLDVPRIGPIPRTARSRRAPPTRPHVCTKANYRPTGGLPSSRAHYFYKYQWIQPPANSRQATTLSLTLIPLPNLPHRVPLQKGTAVGQFRYAPSCQNARCRTPPRGSRLPPHSLRAVSHSLQPHKPLHTTKSLPRRPPTGGSFALCPTDRVRGGPGVSLHTPAPRPSHLRPLMQQLPSSRIAPARYPGLQPDGPRARASRQSSRTPHETPL